MKEVHDLESLKINSTAINELAKPLKLKDPSSKRAKGAKQNMPKAPIPAAILLFFCSLIDPRESWQLSRSSALLVTQS